MRNLLTLIVCVSFLPVCQTWAESPSRPATVYWEADHIVRSREAIERGNHNYGEVLERLRDNADEALGNQPYSVMDKKVLPPSGDKHDYLSYSRYWWPNPDTKDGLPYVQRDGETNRELLANGDRNAIGDLFEDVKVLALAYYFFGEEKYAEHASKLIRTWFLDDETRMNPNLNYAQAVPGRAEGRDVGIIDTRGFIWLLDATALLEGSPSYTEEHEAALRKWFASFLDWLRTSELGIEESEAENNHGSWYDAQASRIAMFVADTDFAKKVVQRVRDERIPQQFHEDGSQPEELERTRSLHYSLFNLAALSVVARVGEHVEVDVWHHAHEGKGMRAALEFLLPFALSEKEWPHPQIGELTLPPDKVNLLRMASVRYNDPRYMRVIEHVPLSDRSQNYSKLLFSSREARESGKSSRQLRSAPWSEVETLSYEMPDISRYSKAYVRKLLPTGSRGVVEVGPMTDEIILEETYRKSRPEMFPDKDTVPQVVKVLEGQLTLAELVEEVNDPQIAEKQKGVITLRKPILIRPEATLIIDGRDTAELRLSVQHRSFLANAGNLFVLDATVTSWDEERNAAADFDRHSDYRPFIASYIRSHTYLAGSRFHELGYHAPTSYGVSLSSQPERHRGAVSDDWPTGILVGNEFRGLYYGFYSYEGRDVVIVENEYENCIRYGIDPHDRTTRLLIARNLVHGTQERHGIIGSRGISHSHIFENTSRDNHGSGIMLDRQCSDNHIVENLVVRNGQGIAIYESSDNVIARNRIGFNHKAGVKVRNSTQIQVRENTIAGNGDYGIELSAKRLDNHEQRTRRNDEYTQDVGVTVIENLITSNDGGMMKGTHVGFLRLGRIKTDVDPDQLRSQMGNLDEPLETDEDYYFGGELKPLADRLQAALHAGDAAVELRSQPSPPKPR